MEQQNNLNKKNPNTEDSKLYDFYGLKVKLSQENKIILAEGKAKSLKITPEMLVILPSILEEANQAAQRARDEGVELGRKEIIKTLPNVLSTAFRKLRPLAPIEATVFSEARITRGSGENVAIANFFLYHLGQKLNIPPNILDDGRRAVALTALYAVTTLLGDAPGVQPYETVNVQVPWPPIEFDLRYGEINDVLSLCRSKVRGVTLRQICRTLCVELNRIACLQMLETTYSRKVERTQGIVLTRAERAFCIPYNNDSVFVKQNFKRLHQVLCYDFQLSTRHKR